MYKKGRKEGRKYLWPIWKFLHHQSSASATVTNSTSTGRMCLAKLKASRYLEQHITLAEIAVNTSRKCTHTLLVWCLGERRNDHLGMNTPIIIIKSMETLFKREREGRRGGHIHVQLRWRFCGYHLIPVSQFLNEDAREMFGMLSVWRRKCKIGCQSKGVVSWLLLGMIYNLRMDSTNMSIWEGERNGKWSEEEEEEYKGSEIWEIVNKRWDEIKKKKKKVYKNPEAKPPFFPHAPFSFHFQ